uniref:Putative bilaris n=1 Tax=Rhipicephalus pulchellus TaxID=72859 RepID=L7LQR0_RHIPC
MKLLHCVLVQLCGTFVQGLHRKPTPPEICQKPPDPGTCEARYPTWYYDNKYYVCKLFYYSGCGGNRNRFNTEIKCQQTCISSRTRASLCSLFPKPVHCRSPFRLSWAFNPRENLCQQYSCGFCGGNSNKFATCTKCMQRCSSINAAEACRLIAKKMEQMKQHGGRLK